MMTITMGTTNRAITFKNRQTRRAKLIPAGQKVRIRDTFAQGNGYTLTTVFEGESCETNGLTAEAFTRD